ncbi:hypothetical protein ACOAPY_07900 [Pseudomonas sp. P3C3]
MAALDWEVLHSGVNVFCRVCHPDYAWVPSFLSEKSIPYIYYLDDNFWCIQGQSELAVFYRSAEVVSTLDAFVRGSALIITHTPTLFEFIRKRFPSLRCELLAAPFDSDLAAGLVDKEGGDNSRDFVVGYAGGYRAEEFDIIEQVVMDLAGRRPDIRFEFIGGVSSRLRQLESVQWFPGFSDYQEFIKFKISRRWSLGLAPLLDSPFNASKTNNKFREYGGCGIPGLYSDVLPYKDCVEHGVTGYLTGNDVESWVSSIVYAADHAGEGRSISRSAMQYVRERYSHRAIASSWLAVIKDVPLASSTRGGGAKSLKLRFNYMKYHYLHKQVANALEVKAASDVALYRRRLYEQLHYWFLRYKVRKFAFALLCVLGIFALLNINAYLLLELFS